jgi:hypothetical protein
MSQKLHLFLPSAVLLVAFAAASHALAQKTIVVNGNPTPPQQSNPYKTIQSGIDAASDGDTVDVEALQSGGGYTENVSFKGKAITVTGVPFAGQYPIVLGTMAEPAFVFQSGETSSSVLSNFNIQNGGSGMEPNFPANPGPYVNLPGAIYISGASPTILNNTISGGYAVYILNGAAPAILDNAISNLACYGLYVSGATPLIQGNTISGVGNCSPFSGSAITLIAGATAFTRIVGNTLENNVESGSFVGLGYVPTGPGGGGAIQVNAPAIILNNIIRNNNSNAAWGGGIDIEGGSVFVVQNLIYGNNSNCGGGAIALPSQSPDYDVAVLIANNTIVDNTDGPSNTSTCAQSAQLFDANINISEDLGPSRVIIVDNIFSGNTNYIDIDCADSDPPNEAFQPTFDHNILFNAGGKFFGQSCVDVSAKYGNLAADPQFNSPSTFDYTLKPTSPAIDTGNTSAIQLFQQLSGIDLTTDITGINPRVVNSTPTNTYPIIDIGAYEFPDKPVTPLPQIPTTMVLSFTFPADFHYVLTAKTQSPLGTPVGPVSFFVDGVPLVSKTTNSSSAQIDATGTATLTDFPLNAGTHALSATYPGHDGNPTFTPAIAIVNIVAIPLIPTHLLIVDSDNGQAPFGSPVTFSVTSTADDGSFPTPVTLTDVTQGILLTTLNFTNSDTASFPTLAPLPIGTHEITAAYAGNLIYAAASDNEKFDSTGSLTNIHLDCGSLPALPVGASVSLKATVTSVDAADGIPPGSVEFKQNSTNLGSSALSSGLATFNAVTVPDNNSFVAIYQSQPGFETSISNVCTINSPALLLATSAPNGAPAYSPITFTANLVLNPPPAGNYQLTIGSNAPVNMTPSADGTSATYTTSTLAQGSYNVTATFIANNNANPYTASLTQLVTAPIGDFTLTGPSTVTARTESIATGTITLTSLYDFSGTIALTCNLPLPTTYSCTINPATVPLAVNAAATATVTLAPTNLHAANNPPPRTSRIILAGFLPLTLLSLFGLTRRRRHTKLRGLLCLAVMTMVISTVTACGPDKFFPATQPGLYPFTITATGTTKGATTPSTHTLNITLNLTP